MVDDLLRLLACIIKAPLHHPTTNAATASASRKVASKANSPSTSRRFVPYSVSSRFFGGSSARSPSPERLNSRESSGVEPSPDREKERSPPGSRNQSLRHVSRMLSRPFGLSEKRPTPVVAL